MYSKIAFSNVKKSIRDYTIYFLTLTFGICLFYMFNSVQAQQAVLKLNESQKSMMHLMSVIINWISVFVAVILGFLIIYANQFLMKRRHKEMGIYLLLGMEKRQVSKILLIETLLIGFFALIAGLIAGVFLSQGLAMLTAKMFAVQMKEFKFVFSQTAFIQTIMYFAIIFIIVMIFNGITISKYKLINLLNAAKKNQKMRLKNPVLSVILFVMSIACIGIAYHLITKNQMLGVDNDFKMSIILGVIGTFLFFFSLSGFLLELAKRNKKFYYNGLNLFVLRQINSKITTTFVSMSMLCLMLFLAISAFATGSGLASSVKTDLEDLTKFDYSFYSLSQKGYQDELQQKFVMKMNSLGLSIEEDAKETLPITVYQNGVFKQCRYKMEPLLKGREKYSDYTKDYVKNLYEVPLTFVKLSEYNKLRKAIGEKELTLKTDEYILNCNYANLIPTMEKTAKEAGVRIVSGDTKVAGKGQVDGVFIKTTGIGEITDGVEVAGNLAKPGDASIVTGDIGRHGCTILLAREDFGIEADVTSDCAPLWKTVKAVMDTTHNLHVIRDATRGGVGTVLYEIAGQSSVGIRLNAEAVPVRPEVKGVCGMLGLEPLYLACEGRLVIMAPKEEAEGSVET